MVKVTRVAVKEEGNGKGGKRDGDGEEEGDGNGNKDGNGKQQQ
jgi:hypothetical protein